MHSGKFIRPHTALATPFSWAAVVLFALAAIVNTSAFAADDTPTTFSHDVLPILQKNCAGCHFPTAEKLRGGLDLSTAANALKGGGSGPSIMAGKADDSPLVKMIEWKAEPHMPPSNKFKQLPPADIATIKHWIAQGAQAGDAAPQPAAKPAPASPTPADKTKPAEHAAPISALAYASVNGELLLASGRMRSVDVTAMDPKTGASTPKFTLDGHAELVRALVFSPDASLLAAAGGLPGRSGEIKLWRVADHSLARTIEGHKDNILGLAFSPDGKRLASCSYDKTIVIWNVDSGEAALTMTEHVDPVYAVAFSPDGKLLASGAGDRTVKIWDADTGKMLVTISDSLDSVYTLAFSPSGKQLAGAGADKMIRIWDMGKQDGPIQQGSVTAGVLLRSTFAHEGAVLRLLYSPDGATLYSTSEDKRIKRWDAETLTEKLAYEPQSDWVTGLALSPDGAVLAAGRYDASLAIYAANDGARLSGDNPGIQLAAAKDADAKPDEGGRKKITSLSVEAVIIKATVPPSVTTVSPAFVPRGAEVELAVDGKNLDQAEPVFMNPKLSATIVENKALPESDMKIGKGPRGTGADVFDNARPYHMKLKMKVPDDTPAGRYELMFRTPIGMSNSVLFTVAPKPDLAEAESNHTPAQAQTVDWPAVVSGQIKSSGDKDYYRVKVKAGQDLVVALTDTMLNASLRLLDATGKVVTTGAEFNDPKNGKLGHHVDADCEYVIEVSDLDLRAGLGYRLHIGPYPWVRSMWPLGIAAGAKQKVAVEGFNIGGATELEVAAPAEAHYSTRAALPIPAVEASPIEIPTVAVGAAAEVTEQEPNDTATQAQSLTFPSTVNGRIQAAQAGGADSDLYRFSAKKGQVVVFETMAARLGSPLDSVIDVLDATGKPLQRGVIRCEAETFLTLSGRDSKSAGYRLDSWRDLKVNDYILAGNEISQITRLPGYADEDVSLKAYASGQRVGFFGTTPEDHAVNAKTYKVEIHPPDTKFAPNGKPIFPLYWRNDDGFFGDGVASGDSYLEFTAPEDGEYIVRIADAGGKGGADYAYRLMLRALEPDFDVFAGPYRVNVAPGSRVPVDVRVLRRDGFNEAVKVAVHGLPEGFTIEPDVIPPGEELVRLALVAGPGAKSTALDAVFKVSAETELNGKPLAHESALGPITVSTVQPDLVVKNGETQVAVAPGKSNTISVHLDRSKEFSSRVPISVLNLPYGVRILNTGLNGILVRDGETDRKMEIYAEPWVEPMTRKIYIQAMIETQTALKPQFVGEPVELRIEKGQNLAAADAPK